MLPNLQAMWLVASKLDTFLCWVCDSRTRAQDSHWMARDKTDSKVALCKDCHDSMREKKIDYVLEYARLYPEKDFRSAK